MKDEKGYLFTPRLKSSRRVEMRLSEEDHAKIGRGRWRAEITDQLTGRRYKVRGAACSIPRCMCDAVVTEEIANG